MHRPLELLKQNVYLQSRVHRHPLLNFIRTQLKLLDDKLVCIVCSIAVGTSNKLVKIHQRDRIHLLFICFFYSSALLFICFHLIARSMKISLKISLSPGALFTYYVGIAQRQTRSRASFQSLFFREIGRKCIYYSIFATLSLEGKLNTGNRDARAKGRKMIKRIAAS